MFRIMIKDAEGNFKYVGKKYKTSSGAFASKYFVEGNESKVFDEDTNDFVVLEAKVEEVEIKKEEKIEEKIEKIEIIEVDIVKNEPKEEEIKIFNESSSEKLFDTPLSELQEIVVGKQLTDGDTTIEVLTCDIIGKHDRISILIKNVEKLPDARTVKLKEFLALTNGFK